MFKWKRSAAENPNLLQSQPRVMQLSEEGGAVKRCRNVST